MSVKAALRPWWIEVMFTATLAANSILAEFGVMETLFETGSVLYAQLVLLLFLVFGMSGRGCS